MQVTNDKSERALIEPTRKWNANALVRIDKSEFDERTFSGLMIEPGERPAVSTIFTPSSMTTRMKLG
jgi:hypothetical protein